MVQADPLRDYYQDLGVHPNVSTEEIQKTFRKLALKYHPDRNPGCEDEFKPKFQIIQAAHEVLIDPERRFKYDQDRKKQLPRTRPPAPPRNAYSTFTTAPSNYPPPPRRAPNFNTQPFNTPPFNTPPFNTPPFNTQAPPRPAPPKPQASTASTSQNGANRFTNFPRPPPTAQRPSPRDDADARRNVFHAWERMNPNKTPPNADDAAYARMRSNTANHASTANTVKPGMGRSNTTRAPKKSGFDPATPGADEPQAHGSAYYTTSRHSKNPPSDQSDSNQSTPRKADPLRHFRAQTGYDEVPFNEGQRHRTPYASTSGERTRFSNEGLGRSASTRSSPRQFSENDASDPSAARPSRHRSVSPQPRRAPFTTSQTSTKKPPRHKPGGNATRPFMYDSSDEEVEGELFSTSPRPKARDPKRASAFPQKSPQNGTQTKKPNGTGTTYSARGSPPKIFTIPTADETFKANFPGVKSRSAESINTTFSPGDWAGTFQGTPDYFAPTGNANTSRSRQSPTRGRSANRPQSMHQSSSQGPPPPPPPPPYFPPPQQTSQMPPPPPPGNTEPAPGVPPVKFSPQEWQQTFKEPSWVYPTSPTRPTSTSTSSKRPNPPKSRKGSVAPKPATVSDAADEPTLNGTSRGRAISVSSESSNAMDIDSETPPVTNGKRRGSIREARTVPASPQRADWKDNTMKQSATAPTSATETQGPGLDGLAGLRNVAPFAPTTDGGLRDLNDLGSTLPFNSAASTTHPLKPSTVEKFNLPLCPKPPEEPVRLTKQSFALYMQRMYNYVSIWNKFNQVMLDHFNARRKWLENLSPAWLTDVGEPTGRIGFDGYMLALEEDRQTRSHWEVGCDKHHQAMAVCQRVRQTALKGLPEK